MTELHLVDTETLDVLARLRLDGDQVVITGEDADTARSILLGRMRAYDLDEAGAFDRLQRYGWANGPLALRSAA